VLRLPAAHLQAGHWLMEERPDAVIALAGKFLANGDPARK
jgi:pimeloyl-ACP methyl ester carboxylesterase